MSAASVLVVAEHLGGVLRDVSLELVSAAKELGNEVVVALVGKCSGALAPGLNVEGVKEILVLEGGNAEPTSTDYYDGLLATISRYKPKIVLGAHSVEGMGWGGAVAASANTGFASAVRAIKVDGSDLVCQREIFGGKLTVEIDFPGTETVLVLLMEGVFPPAGGKGNAAVTHADAVPSRTKSLGYSDAVQQGASIEDADFILSIGRGVKDQDDVARFDAVATALGATLASSRPLVDSGWLPAARQVGQSGRTVKPKVYLAFGISGASQHLAGMRKSGTVIAINSDAEAPIYRIAQYGATTDLNEVLAALEDELELA